VPIRQSYGRTECAFITAETAPWRKSGRRRWLPVFGVEICCGETPETAVPPGESGESGFAALADEGYGYPPNVLRITSARRLEWHEDVGTLTPEGRLILLGGWTTASDQRRHLVSPAQVANALRAHPRVLDSVVVPVPLGGAP